MKCEICHLNDAVKAIRRDVDGETRELFVCELCARQAPHGGVSSLTDVLFSLGLPGLHAPIEKISEGVCPVCGLSRESFRETRMAGCPACYTVFAGDIRSIIPVSISEMSESSRASSDVDSLKKKLKEAVEAERFEEAALLRDEIRKLSASDVGGGPE